MAKIVHNAYDYDWPIVEVAWVDSIGCGVWQGREEWTLKRMIIKTAGYLFKDLSDRVVIVQSLSALDSLDNQICIPRCAIKSIVYLWDGEDSADG